MVYANPSSKVFHRPTCGSFKQADDAPAFGSAAEALAAGLRPCRICKP